MSIAHGVRVGGPDVLHVAYRLVVTHEEDYRGYLWEEGMFAGNMDLDGGAEKL